MICYGTGVARYGFFGLSVCVCTSNVSLLIPVYYILGWKSKKAEEGLNPHSVKV